MSKEDRPTIEDIATAYRIIRRFQSRGPKAVMKQLTDHFTDVKLISLILLRLTRQDDLSK